MKQLERLLFIQGGRCFFCKNEISKSNASIEHLVATSNGGQSSEENCVVCCKTINEVLGNKSIKEKIEILLRQGSSFLCPQSLVASNTPIPPDQRPSPATKTAVVVSKIGMAAAKPVQPVQPMFTLASPASKSSTPAAESVIGSMPKAQIQVTCPTCKRAVLAVAGQTEYKCAACGTAFRY